MSVSHITNLFCLFTVTLSSVPSIFAIMINKNTLKQYIPFKPVGNANRWPLCVSSFHLQASKITPGSVTAKSPSWLRCPKCLTHQWFWWTCTWPAADQRIWPASFFSVQNLTTVSNHQSWPRQPRSHLLWAAMFSCDVTQQVFQHQVFTGLSQTAHKSITQVKYEGI